MGREEKSLCMKYLLVLKRQLIEERHKPCLMFPLEELLSGLELRKTYSGHEEL